jgi:hypothetical protein
MICSRTAALGTSPSSATNSVIASPVSWWPAPTGWPGADGVKPPWRARKERYLAYLAAADEDVLLVSLCDKLHNVRAIAADIEADHDVFARFNADAGREGTLWYYNELVRVFRARMGEESLPVRTLAGAIARISLSDSPKSRPR